MSKSACLLRALVAPFLLCSCTIAAAPPPVTGWWVLDKQPNDVYHIDDETRMYEYNADWQQPLMFLDECDLYLPMLEPDGAFRLRWTYGGFHDAGGRYAVHVADQNTLLWHVVDDEEYQRTFSLAMPPWPAPRCWKR